MIHNTECVLYNDQQMILFSVASLKGPLSVYDGNKCVKLLAISSESWSTQCTVWWHNHFFAKCIGPPTSKTEGNFKGLCTASAYPANRKTEGLCIERHDGISIYHRASISITFERIQLYWNPRLKLLDSMREIDPHIWMLRIKTWG